MTIALNDLDIQFEYDKDTGELGIPLVWVIDGKCVYDIATTQEYGQILLSINKAEDISFNYPEHSGMVIRLSSDEESKIDLFTTEYFGSVLLSNPTVLDLRDYAYGAYVDSPNAEFDGEKFIITNKEMDALNPWPTYSPEPANYDLLD